VREECCDWVVYLRVNARQVDRPRWQEIEELFPLVKEVAAKLDRAWPTLSGGSNDSEFAARAAV